MMDEIIRLLDSHGGFEQTPNTEMVAKEITKLFLESLPKEMDDRPQIEVWLFSEDYTKGFNQALKDIRERWE